MNGAIMKGTTKSFRVGRVRADRRGKVWYLSYHEDEGWLHIRNKPALGWQVKTRNEQEIPLMACLVDVLRCVVGDRRTGPVFL